MKPVFGIDVSKDKRNGQMDGSVFRAATLSCLEERGMDEAAQDAAQLLRRAKLPLPLRVIRWTAGMGGAILAVALLKALADVSFEEAYGNAPWVFWGTGGLLLVFGALWLWEWLHAKRVLEGADAERVTADLASAAADAREMLGIPQNARQVDVIAFRYVRRRGEPVPRAHGMEMTPYRNPEVWLFVEDGRLCLSDLRERYELPLSEVRGIREVRKRISVSGWNKDVSPQSGRYKPYKLVTNEYGCVFMRSYYVLELTYGGEDYGVYFPPYELPYFEAATGYRAVTAEERSFR